MATRGAAAGKLTVAETLASLREPGKTAFIPFITAGDPDLATTSKALKVLNSCGSDVIEIGVPYSDPLADGPVIQASATRALKNGLLSILPMTSDHASHSQVSVNGVTGARANVNTRVESLIQEVKQVTDKPVAVGFSISKPEHVKQIAEWGADGVIIGSAMVRQLGEAASPKEGLKRLEKYARSMKSALP